MQGSEITKDWLVKNKYWRLSNNLVDNIERNNYEIISPLEKWRKLMDTTMAIIQKEVLIEGRKFTQHSIITGELLAEIINGGKMKRKKKASYYVKKSQEEKDDYNLNRRKKYEKKKQRANEI